MDRGRRNRKNIYMKSKNNLEKKRLISISCFGLNILVDNSALINDKLLREKITAILPMSEPADENCRPDFVFNLIKNPEIFELQFNRTEKHLAVSEEILLILFERELRLAVAEFSVNKVFLHAGVVGWKERAIIIPARSFQGKTTLVAELVKQGATYFSDEYAVLDENACVHPFPKPLSLRGIINDFEQLDTAVEELGGIRGKGCLPVGMVLITEYLKDGVWQPEPLKQAAAIMEIIPHTMTMHSKPEFTLSILNKLTTRAIIVKTSRGEATKFAEIILKFLETQLLILN